MLHPLILEKQSHRRCVPVAPNGVWCFHLESPFYMIFLGFLITHSISNIETTSELRYSELNEFDNVASLTKSDKEYI
jgi:hypothetical protein